MTQPDLDAGSPRPGPPIRPEPADAPSAARRGLGRLALGRHGIGRVVARTSLFNSSTALIAGVAGALIARALGPAARGDYASVMVWFGTLLGVGQLGLTAATTYFVARHPRDGADYVATSRNLMVCSGAVTVTAGLLVAPVLAHGQADLTAAFRIMFVTCVVGYVGASYTFGLHALHIPLWNVVRISQAIMFAGAIAVLYALLGLTLRTVLLTLSATFLVQAGLAYGLCRRHDLTGGRGRGDLARPMSRYGLTQLAAIVPMIIASRLDQLVLSFAVAPAAFGHYAVAASLTGLGQPAVAAVGNVAFPRLASQALSPASADRFQRWSIVVSAAVATLSMLVLVGASGWLVPAVFGPEFRAAVPLILLLAPSGVLLACAQVCGDLLLGHGRPRAVARAQLLAAAVMAAVLFILLPRLGVAGAAIASDVGGAVAVAWMIGALRTRAVRPLPARAG